MKMKILTLLITIGLISSGAISLQATLFLDTWGVSHLNWNPVNAKTAGGLNYVDYCEEDYVGPPNGQVGPGWGGDAYDVEAVYYGLDNSYAYFAIVTGFPLVGRPWNNDYYLPGDIAIDFDNDDSYEYGIDVDKSGNLRYGSIGWENAVVSQWGGVSDPWRVFSSINSVPIYDFSYGAFDGRYAIEAVVDRSQLSNNGLGSYHIHWTMECGNDAGDLKGVAPVPEPSTLVLLGTGLIGLGAYGRFRRKKR